jgi:hypothetical protein
VDPRLHRIVAAQPYPLLFATISGAHLYPDASGSPDSDFDLRGAHVLPLERVIGQEVRDGTIGVMEHGRTQPWPDAVEASPQRSLLTHWRHAIHRQLRGTAALGKPGVRHADGHAWAVALTDHFFVQGETMAYCRQQCDRTK